MEFQRYRDLLEDTKGLETPSGLYIVAGVFLFGWAYLRFFGLQIRGRLGKHDGITAAMPIGIWKLKSSYPKTT